MVDPGRRHLRVTRWPLSGHGVAGAAQARAVTRAEPIYLQVLDLADLDHLDLVAESVAPALVGGGAVRASDTSCERSSDGPIETTDTTLRRWVTFPDCGASS